ncbi:MAG: type II toxin-antitoxin system HicA family toxin [Oscillospiraceae bacterium]|jgi:hypothetical protein|nr:type II toxin-antitoxin system HicA family toxin [Oscillospiraceae bacterium]
MSRKEKLIIRLKSKPRDFEFREAETLMKLCGYTLTNAGKTSGSQIYFVKDGKVFSLHKPHPRKELLPYQIIEILDELEGLM